MTNWTCVACSNNLLCLGGANSSASSVRCPSCTRRVIHLITINQHRFFIQIPDACVKYTQSPSTYYGGLGMMSTGDWGSFV